MDDTACPTDGLAEMDGYKGALVDLTVRGVASNSDLSETTVFGRDSSSKGSSTAPTPDLEKENALPIYTLDAITAEAEAEAQEPVDDEALSKGLPWHVRRIVSLHDDPTLPTITFRYFLLTLIFIPPGAFLQQLSMFRTTFAPYSIFFVQVCASYVGDWLARILPSWTVRIPFTKLSFNLNPGPFSSKEHVLVVIAAASGATYNIAYTPLSLSELYFKEKINPAVWIFFMLAITLTGYSYAAIARQFLIYDPDQPW